MGITKTQRRLRLKKGIRRKLSGTSERPRLSVYKGNKNIYAQIIDDSKGHTLAFCSSKEIGAVNNPNIEVSKKVGKKLAEKAAEQGVNTIVFDRSGYLYHGRIKALADGVRDGGLKF